MFHVLCKFCVTLRTIYRYKTFLPFLFINFYDSFPATIIWFFVPVIQSLFPLWLTYIATTRSMDFHSIRHVFLPSFYVAIWFNSFVGLFTNKFPKNHLAHLNEQRNLFCYQIGRAHV